MCHHSLTAGPQHLSQLTYKISVELLVEWNCQIVMLIIVVRYRFRLIINIPLGKTAANNCCDFLLIGELTINISECMKRFGDTKKTKYCLLLSSNLQPMDIFYNFSKA